MTRSQSPSIQKATPSLTYDTIRKIAGEISDAKAAAILASGATLEDLEEAVAWASGQADVMGELGLSLSGVVAEVYDVLTADEDYGDERD